MTFPFHIRIGSLDIPVHAVFETLGFFAGYRYFVFLRKKEHDLIQSENRYWIIIGATFGALIGSRLIGALENPIEWQQAGNKLLYLYQSKTIVGGFLGGLTGVELIKKVIHERHSSGDLFVFPILLALIIGRIGCFTMGIYEETYGLPTTLPWGMNLGDGIYRHPVTLYEMLFLGLLWIVLKRASRIISLDSGASFKIFMISYLAFRLLLDFIKPRAFTIAGFSTIQLTCILGLVYYYRYLVRPTRLTTYA